MKTNIIDEENGAETLEQLIAIARAKNENEINGINVNLPAPPPEAKAARFEYRLYPKVPVTLNYQNQGSVWMLILRGNKQDIEDVFNGLSNLGATATPEPQYTGANDSTAICWSSPNEMRKFYVLRHEMRCGGVSRAHVEHEFKKFKENCSEVFIDFHNINLGEPMDLHDMGKISAEKPDNDFRDAMWNVEARGLFAPL